MSQAKQAKYVFVTGGVVSSLGKGIISASLGKLLQARGYSVTIQKFDPYLNVDPGTLNPYEHGEVFVTEDGAETDLDLGHYERFLNVATSQANNLTTGRIYQTIIQQERDGFYQGKTVQVIPHVTDEIKRCMRLLGDSGEYDIVISEIGGTVGDIESLPFIEAARQLNYELGINDVIIIHLTLMPYIQASEELKTKPTQHTVKQLLQSGVQPDILVCRTAEHKLSRDIRHKIALFCNINVNAVIEARDASSIYEVPLFMKREQFDRVVLSKLRLPLRQEPELTEWRAFLQRLQNPTDEVQLGLVGKYAELPDAYKSILEALVHAGAANELKVHVELIHAEDVNEENAERLLGGKHGIIVAPGFGQRGAEGKITTVRFAREQGVPFLGICLGMQMAVVEFGRNVLGLEDCHSTEFKPDAAHPVISLMQSQASVTQMGGTMRLGTYDCEIEKETLAYRIFRKRSTRQRHRHRYEFNNAYATTYQAAGMQLSGINPENQLVEMIELAHHPFFLACQFHPEYKSTVEKPHAMYTAMVKAMAKYKQQPVELQQT
jgi:CTP synthase